ncbi:MAG: hypothetical protein A2138_23875 [Deltaproteobacteria bacterium RBG_16_71_12]|nr:MAG: hypothetical protein A2138_23875 [Deltaproteobacteria bacterium RBG_16_71_12]
MGPTVGKVLLEIVKALGKAVVAGVGVELARAASGHVQKRFGPKKEDKKPEEMTPEELRKENERLRAEVEELKERLGTSTVPPDVAIGS